MIERAVNGVSLLPDKSQEKLHINPKLFPSRKRGRWGLMKDC